MYLLDDVQINQISGARSPFIVTGSTALFIALYLYYTQADENSVKFQEIENRLSKLELLTAANNQTQVL